MNFLIQVLKKSVILTALILIGICLWDFARKSSGKTRALVEQGALSRNAWRCVSVVGVLISFAAASLPMRWSSSLTSSGLPFPITLTEHIQGTSYYSPVSTVFLFPLDLAFWFGATHYVAWRVISRSQRVSK